MNCAECGERLPAGARFCSACGRRVGEPVTCPACDTEVAAGARFCFRCGSALGGREKVEPVLDPAKLDAVAPAPTAAEPERRAEPLWPAPPLVPIPPQAAEPPRSEPAPEPAPPRSAEPAPAEPPLPPAAPENAAPHAPEPPPKREPMLAAELPTSKPPVAPAPSPAAEPPTQSPPASPSIRDTERPSLKPSARELRAPAAAIAQGGVRRSSKALPAALVALGALLGVAAVWTSRVEDAAFKTEAARRMELATGALPSTTQRTTNEDAAFSTRQALQGLYGSYDPHLDGVFWTVTGAPTSLREWNGRTVLIKPLVSRTDPSGTRHVLVTNSVEVKGGLVVKQGAGCRECKSLLGAALFERRGDAWVLAQEQRFLRAEGAFGAPPKVAVSFPSARGAEVRIETANASYLSVLTGVQPDTVASAASGPREVAPHPNATAPLSRETTAPAREAAPVRETAPPAVETAAPPEAGSASARNLVNAAIKGEDARFRALAAQLRAQQPPRGNRGLARSLNDRGLALARRGEYAEAAQLFRHAHDADRGDAEIRENLGYALLKAGRVNDAETALVAAIEIAPERASAWGSLGHVYAKRGKRAEAVALLRTAHRVAPDPQRVLDTYARQAETEPDPRIRALLAETVTQIASAR